MATFIGETIGLRLADAEDIHELQEQETQDYRIQEQEVQESEQRQRIRPELPPLPSFDPELKQKLGSVALAQVWDRLETSRRLREQGVIPVAAFYEDSPYEPYREDKVRPAIDIVS